MKHGPKRVDLSLRFGASGLANNAKLELVKLDQPRNESQPVKLVIQLENGQRLQRDYQSNATLLSILSDWKAAGKIEASLEDEPIANEENALRSIAVVYTRDEVIGKFALERTTLKHLGVLSGTALLRVVVRRVDAHQLNEIRHTIEKHDAERVRYQQEAQRQALQEAEAHAEAGVSTRIPEGTLLASRLAWRRTLALRTRRHGPVLLARSSA
jgi:hypothetical protein